METRESRVFTAKSLVGRHVWEDCLCEQIRPANVASHVSPSVKAPCFAPCMFSGWPPNPVPVSWIKWKTWKPKTGLKHIVQTTEPSERWFLMVPRCSSALLQLGLGFEMEQDTDHFCLSLATGTAEPPSDVLLGKLEGSLYDMPWTNPTHPFSGPFKHFKQLPRKTRIFFYCILYLLYILSGKQT